MQLLLLVYGFEFAWTGCKLCSKLGGRLNRRGLRFPFSRCCSVVLVLVLCGRGLSVFCSPGCAVPFRWWSVFLVVGVWCFVAWFCVVSFCFCSPLFRLSSFVVSSWLLRVVFSLLVLVFSFLLSLCGFLLFCFVFLRAWCCLLLWFSSLLFCFSSWLVLPSLFLFPSFSFPSFVVFPLFRLSWFLTLVETSLV